MNYNPLILAGSLSFVAAILHIGVILGGSSWYRFFGAGEEMAILAEQGSIKPTLITLGIAFILSIWGAYAWSGAGLLPKLPFLKLALIVITTIYLVRGIFGLIAPFVTNHPIITQNSTSFWVWSSLICLIISLFHIIGLTEKWAVI
jgi:hypothetical protein